jgi:hypothetical protein
VALSVALLVALFALLPPLWACTRGPTTEARLLEGVRTALAEREAKVRSLHLAGTVTEAGQQLAFELRYRAPSLLRASVPGPTGLTLSFDGERLHELLPAQRALRVYTLKLPPQEAALLLATRFGPFLPDGFRAPLLPRTGVRAREVRHARAERAVELRFETRSDGEPVTVTYVLRPPGMDLLHKRTETRGASAEVHVDAERCEPALGLCFPEQLSETLSGAAGARTHLSTLEVNPPISPEHFRLNAPESFEKSEHVLAPVTP